MLCCLVVFLCGEPYETCAFLSILAISLTACGDSPRIISSNIEGVAYRFDGTDEEFKEVNDMAMEECQRFGRTAVLKNTSPMDEDFIANFGCVKG